MRFPFDDDVVITHDFHEIRKYGKHKAFDLVKYNSEGIPVSFKGYAPEDGFLHYDIFLRGKRKRGDDSYGRDITWPNGAWYPFSRYHMDVYGGLAVLIGCRYKYLFTHLDISFIFMQWVHGQKKFDCPKQREDDYNYFVRRYTNMADPWQVKEGDRILQAGTEGTDSATHVHWEIHPRPDSWWKRLDPALIFPAEYKERFVGGRK